MVARLLNLAGVFLGPEFELLRPAPDNPEGFWENVLFLNFNNRLLHRLGGSWHAPPRLDAGWERRADFQPLFEQARELLQRFDHQRPWGWKDPRNCLTIPFWRQLIPDLKIVVCLRNPFDVARSLSARGENLPFLDLWLTYNQQLLAGSRGEDRLITHYDAYFHNPEAECRRLLDYLDIKVSDGVLREALASIQKPLRHHDTSLADVLDQAPAEVLDCYMKLCTEAGPVFADWLRQRPIHLCGGLRAITPRQDEAIGYRDALGLLRLDEERQRLEHECRDLNDKLASAHEQLALARTELDGIGRSRTWRMLNGARRLVNGLFTPFRMVRDLFRSR